MSAPHDLASVRLTAKKANAEIPPALFRRTVAALAEVSGSGVRESRQRVTAWLAGGAAASDLEAWLRANYRIDPTGVTAVRNVSRRRG